MECGFSSEVIDGVELSRISVEGELDLTTVELLEPHADAAIAAKRPVVVDLSRRLFMDSTGLRLILLIHQGLAETGELGVPMAVVARADGIKRLFSVTSLDKRIPVFACEQEALRQLSENARLRAS